MHNSERRQSRRFKMQYPVTVKYGNDDKHELSGMTEDTSLRGLLLVADTPLQVGVQAEVNITLQENEKAVSLSGSGAVVRVEARMPNEFAIVIALDKQLSPL